MQDESRCYKCGGDLVVRARYSHTIVAKVPILYYPLSDAINDTPLPSPDLEDKVYTTGVDYFCLRCGEPNAVYTISTDEAARNGILYSEDLVGYFTR